MYIWFKKWLQQKVLAFKAKLRLPQYAEKRKEVLIRGMFVALLFAAVTGLYIVQAGRDEASLAFKDMEKDAEIGQKEPAKPVYIAENDYWLEPEEPTQVEDDAIINPQGGQAVSPQSSQHEAEKSKAEKEKTPVNEQREDSVSAMAGLSWPVLPPAEGEWGKVFGYAYDATWQDYRFHKGVDMPLSVGTHVVAVWDGEVESISTSKNLGTVLTLRHGEKLQTVYMGLQVEADLQQGNTVAAGEKLGTVSEPPLFEKEEGAHLHFEIWEKGKAVDPLSYLP